MPEREQEFDRLTHDYQAARDVHDSLLKRFDEAQLGETMEVDRQGERFRILEPALPPPSPTAPDRFQLLLVGLLLASVVRLVLPTREAGMLAVRHRVVDCVMLSTVGVILVILASTIPNQPL